MLNFEKWFYSSPVWTTRLDNIDNNQIIKYVEQLRSSRGIIRSNEGGWHSEEISASNLPECLVALNHNINLCLKEISEQYDFFSQLSVDNYWFNINGFGHFNINHHHPSSIISGSYYVKTDGSGFFKLHRNEMESFLWQTFTSGRHPDTSDSVRYKPEESRVIFFPSWASHSVEKNESDCERISIAFNAS